MATERKTIDNLGVEASINYARNQELYDSKYTEEVRTVSSSTEISSFSPIEPSEFLQKYNTELYRENPWATIPETPEHLKPNKTLFSHQTIPSLGSSEKIESDLEKLIAIANQEPHDPSQEENRLKIQKLLEQIRSFDKTIWMINGNRGKFQRG